MNILGINFSHDPSACLIIDGALVCFIEEEKLSRIKSELVFPVLSLQYIFERHHILPEAIDLVAFGGHVYDSKTKLELKCRITKRKIYRRFDYFLRLLSLIGLRKPDTSEANKPAFEKMLRSTFGLVRAQFVYYPHHLAHAASAHFTAPFTSDLSITCDGRGETDAFNFYLPDAQGNLQLVRQNGHESSIGQLYSAVTILLGFKAIRHEGKIMGLAASGKKTDLSAVLKQLFYAENGVLRRKPDDQAIKQDIQVSLYQRFKYETALAPDGQSYTYRSMWLLSWLKEHTTGYTPADIAFAVQDVTEQVVLAEMQDFITQNKVKTPIQLSLSGGVFANVRLNQKIKALDSVGNIFVQPAMNDAGLALGAAILADRAFRKPDAVYRLPHNYFGADFSREIEIALEQAVPYFKVKKMENAPAKIAQMLLENKIIGFYHGSMEFGLRALGHRSIIANTFRKEINAELNKRLNRTEFMPFAPSMLDTFAEVYLENYDPNCVAADYMTITYQVKPEYQSLLQAVVHVDGSCRPHVVRRAVNPYYYDVLAAYAKLSGCGAVVNTSFNAHEEPIIATPAQALKALRDGRVDVLILGNYLVYSKNPEGIICL